MARAYNIHIVMREGRVLAAFTVRHELETWLTKQKWSCWEYAVVTVRDGVCPEETQPVLGL